MQFPILLKTGSTRYHLICQLWYADNRMEQYRITAKNNPVKFILVQNNRPMLRAKGLKHRRINWKLVEGSLSNQVIFDQLTKLIQNCIEPFPPEKPLFDLDLNLPDSQTTNNRKKPVRDIKPLGERQ